MNTTPSRRTFIKSSLATAGLATAPATLSRAFAADKKQPAQIAITLDLEMSRHYPKRGMMEWDFQKGNLDKATKDYSVAAARLVKQLGGVIHFFCVGRVLEQPNVDWLKQIAALGHPVGNHTYDHVNVLATSAVQTQFRFQRSPWLVAGKTAAQVIRENIRVTNVALKQRAGIVANGFRTPGGFHSGLKGREDVQQLMLELGFRWISAKYPPHPSGEPKQEPSQDVYDQIIKAQEQAQPFRYPSGLIEIPMSPISDVTAFRSKFWKLAYFKRAIRGAVEWAIENGGVFDFLCHPSCMVIEDPQMETLRMICELVKEAGDRAQIVGLDAIAKRVA